MSDLKNAARIGSNVAAKQPNAVGPITLGRKSWLFIGGTNASPRAAAIMSLIATYKAKANGVRPQAWVTDVLTRLPTTRNLDFDSLLPIESWAAASRCMSR